MARIVPQPRAANFGELTEARPSWVTTAFSFLRTYPYLVPALFFFVGWQILPINGQRAGTR